jgi:putative glutamine amidotransferase
MKRIGIVGNLIDSPSDSPFHDWKRDITSQAYTNGVVLGGGLPLLLPILDDPALAREQVSMVDGLLLQGGEDVNPSLYGEEKDTLCGTTDIKNDRYQIALIREAEKKGIPMMGICKGCQILNVAFGGTLYQDYTIRDEHSFHHNHYEDATEPCHQIDIMPDSFLDLVFHTGRIGVNSLHHQQVAKLGEGFHAAATCTEDGGIEAIENRERRIIAVQWHPEAMLMASSSMLPLWKYFVSLC